MTTKTLVLRSEDSKLMIQTENEDLFNHFLKWLKEYVKFSKIEETQFSIKKEADMLKCRLKASRMGFAVTVN